MKSRATVTGRDNTGSVAVVSIHTASIGPGTPTGLQLPARAQSVGPVASPPTQVLSVGPPPPSTTTIVALSAMPSDVAVILVLPLPIAVTRPFWSTAAMLAFPDCQMNAAELTGAPNRSKADAENCTCPLAVVIVSVTGVTTTAVTAFATTRTRRPLVSPVGR